MKLNLLSFSTTFQLNNTPIDFTGVDTTDYSANAETDANGAETFAINHTQVEGIFDARLPNGNLFYDGDGSFASPDIDRDVTDTFAGTPITLDADGNMIEGTYSFDYTVKITGERYDFPIVSIQSTGSKGLIVIAGDYVDEINDYTDLTLNGTNSNDGGSPYTLDTISYNSATNRTTVQVTVDLTPETPPGAARLELTATREYTLSHSYLYAYTATEVEIAVTANCDSSTLRSEDETDYSQYDGNAPISRSHTVRYPVDLVPAQANVVQPLAIISVNPIYTNVWTSTVISTVNKTGSDGLIIQDSISGAESIDVQCNTEWCDIFSALEAVSASYTAAVLNTYPGEISRWGAIWEKIQGYEMLWRIARTCGDATAQSKYYALTIATAEAAGCKIESDLAVSPVSVAVQPITTGGLNTVYNELVNQWFTGAGIPSDSIHDDGDFYLQSGGAGAGDVYQKVAGTWGTAVMNIKGVAGSNGANGTNGLNGLNGTALLFSDGQTSQLAGGPFAYTDMPSRSYTMPAGTLSNGDVLRVRTELYRDDYDDDGITINVGTNKINIGAPIAPLKPPQDLFVLQLDLIKVSATILKVIYTAQAHYTSGTVQSGVPTYYPINVDGISQVGSITVVDIDLNSLKIALQVSSGTNVFTSQFMSIEQLIA